MSAVAGGVSRAAAYSALEACSLVVGFLAQPLLMRAMGPGDYGRYALAMAWGVAAVNVTDFGFNVSGIRRAIEIAHDPIAAHRHFWSVQQVKALAGAAVLAVALAWAWASDAAQAPVVLLAVAMGVCAAWCFPSWFLFSRQKLLAIAASLLAARLLGLGLIAAFADLRQSFGWALLVTLGAPIVAGSMLCLDGELRRAWRRPAASGAPAEARLRSVAADGLSTLWLSIQGVISAAVMQSLLGAAAGVQALGLFAAADRVRAGVQGLFTAFGQAVFPRILQLRAHGGPEGGRAAGPLLRLQAGAALAVAVLACAGAPLILRVISGTAFDEAVPALRVLAWALATTTILAALGLQVLVPAGQSRRYGLTMAAVLAVQAVLVLLLAPRWGAAGAAVAQVAAEAVAVVSLLLWLQRRRRAPATCA